MPDWHVARFYNESNNCLTPQPYLVKKQQDIYTCIHDSAMTFRCRDLPGRDSKSFA